MTETELLIVLAAIVLGSAVKSITGMGLPIISIPVTALFVDVNTAVVVIALPNLVANGYLAWRERHHWADARDLPTLLAANVVGGVLGALAFVWLPETPLLILLIITISAYIALQLSPLDFSPSEAVSARLAPGAGLLSGLFQGSIGISGPMVVSWVHSLKLTREAFVLSITSIFFVSGLAQFTVFAAQGELEGRTVATLLACIPVLITTALGARLRGRFSVTAFNRAVLVLLTASVVSLGYRVVSG